MQSVLGMWADIFQDLEKSWKFGACFYSDAVCDNIEVKVKNGFRNPAI